LSSSPDDPRSPQIRRHPTGPVSAEETSTHLIRRVPLGQQEASTPLIPAPADTPASGRTAFAASAAAILSGWPTAVVATDLVSGWWDTDRLFCLAVGFLNLVYAAATVCGVILLLLRRAVGRYLIALGAGLALLTFGSVFLAGAKAAWPVYLIPLLPLASLVLALLPATGRWCSGA
jgi:hypothetical protein